MSNRIRITKSNNVGRDDYRGKKNIIVHYMLSNGVWKLSQLSRIDFSSCNKQLANFERLRPDFVLVLVP